jgi:uncharacterized membrane protein
MMRSLQVATLIAATITVGLMAGVFGLYAHTIMPGLGKTDDRTFVGAFQEIDRAIINPLFIPIFIGALGLIGLAVALHLAEDKRAALPWIVAALVLYLAVFVITIRVNVPLNDDIKAAGDPDHIADLAAVRHRFNEARWAACRPRPRIHSRPRLHGMGSRAPRPHRNLAGHLRSGFAYCRPWAHVPTNHQR